MRHLHRPGTIYGQALPSNVRCLLDSAPMSAKTKRSLSGIRPSGNVHLGNYLGMLKPALARQAEFQCFYFIVDLHALTTTKDPTLLREKTLDITATWLALGLDTREHLLYRQSDVAMVTEFAWYLSSVTGMGLLEKAHAYKDAAAQAKELNHAVFAYPVLMAADILMYDVDVVPVGKDQKQHVEMARDMAGSFNALTGSEAMKLPTPVIDERVMTIPGLDGRKMSKSYGNEIGLFSDEKTLRKLVMSIKTDSTALEEKKVLKGSLVGDLFELFAPPAAVTDLSERLAKGGLGWGHAKEELFNAINDSVREPRDRYYDLRANAKHLNDVLEDGASRAFAVAKPVLDRVRAALGFRKAPLEYRPQI